MIRYVLKCSEGHQFDSWFKSADTYDDLSKAGHVTCAVCGTASVQKAVMAPPLASKTGRTAPAEMDESRPLSKPATQAEQTLRDIRQYVEKNSDYVGTDFANEARKIHEGSSPDRAIYGEAKPDEAKKLIDDGVSVAPLPFMPHRKTN